jgi:hypothetical protein
MKLSINRNPQILIISALLLGAIGQIVTYFITAADFPADFIIGLLNGTSIGMLLLAIFQLSKKKLSKSA